LEFITNSLCVIARDLPFPINFIEWDKNPQEYKIDETLILKAVPVNHRTACFAYSVELLRRGKFDPERAKEQDIPLKLWGQLQRQTDANIVYEGRTFTSDMVLGAPRKGLKLVFCTDTRPVAALPSFAEGADLFICEGLYGDDEFQEKAASRKHMIFSEAAELAKKAGARELWLTHYSPALPDPYNYLEFATKIFPATKTGKDRMTKTLKFADE
jgi:ribonuclease Z